MFNPISRLRNHSGFALAALVVLAALTGAARAQQTTGNVRGVVNDPTGAVVPGVKVTILDPKTNSTQTTQTTGGGEFEFKNLPVGDYQITIEASGFKKVTLSDVRIQLNQT